MGLDFLNEKELYEKAIAPAIEQLTAQTVPALQKALDAVVAEAIEKLDAVLVTAFVRLAIERTALTADVEKLLAGAFEKLAIERAAILAGVDAAIARVDGAKLTLGPRGGSQ